MQKIHWLKKYLPLALACSLINPSASFAQTVAPEDNVNNRVTIDDGEYEINGENFSAEDAIDIVKGGGSEATSNDVLYNNVTIDGGDISDAIGGVSAAGEVKNNTVTVNDGTLDGVIGGLSIANHSLSNEAGNVSGNRVVIHGGTIQFVSGGEVAYTYTRDGDGASTSTGANVFNNIVEINGGTIGSAIGGAALNGDAYGNTINLNGGTIEGEVIGGLSRDGTARNNTININGAADLINAYLIGGVIGNDRSPHSDGNTLNVNTSGVTAKNISGFQNLNFNLPSDVGAGSTVMTLTEGRTDLDGMNLSVNASADSPLDINDKFNLIVNTDQGLDGDVNFSGMMGKGASSAYGLDVNIDGNALTATVGELFVNHIEDVNGFLLPTMVDPPKIEDATEEFEETQATEIEMVREQSNFEIFANTGGGHFKVKTGNGSYIKTNMGSFDIGIARQFQRKSSVLTVAPVIEYGRGTFDSYQRSGVRGDGRQYYLAGGVVVRSMNNSGFYYEGSFRAGKSDTRYSSNDFKRMGELVRVSYHNDAPVINSHVRVGKKIRMGKNNVLDVYGFYAYARQGSSSTTLNWGDRYHFSSTDCGRLKTGYRLTSRLNAVSSIYTGLAYQYDDNSSSTSTTGDKSVKSVGEKGSSGMLEIGWMVRPIKDNPWMIDINTTGWCGIQQGVSAMAKLTRSF